MRMEDSWYFRGILNKRHELEKSLPCRLSSWVNKIKKWIFFYCIENHSYCSTSFNNFILRYPFHTNYNQVPKIHTWTILNVIREQRNEMSTELTFPFENKFKRFEHMIKWALYVHISNSLFLVWESTVCVPFNSHNHFMQIPWPTLQKMIDLFFQCFCFSYLLEIPTSYKLCKDKIITVQGQTLWQMEKQF